MQKMFPAKPPIDLVLAPVVEKLLVLFGRNGYNHMAISIIVHDLDTQETAMSANLKVEGLQALLSSAISKLLEDENDHPLQG